MRTTWAVGLFTLAACGGGPAAPPDVDLAADYVIYFEPPPPEDVFARLTASWSGSPAMPTGGYWLRSFAVVSHREPSTFHADVPALDGCSVVDISPDGAGTIADGGALEVRIGADVYQEAFDPQGGYAMTGEPTGSYPVESTIEPPEWGAPISVALAGNGDIPGFDLEEVASVPVGPVTLLTPSRDWDDVIGRADATVAWVPLFDAPLVAWINAGYTTWQCIVADDGLFAIPDDVLDVLGGEPGPVDVHLTRPGGAAVEVTPDRWVVVAAGASADVSMTVDPTR